MNAKRRDTAIKTFGWMHEAGNSKEELVMAMTENGLYTEAEALEVYAVLERTAEDAPAHLQTYEHWKVVPQYKGNAITGWRRIEECIAVVRMEPRHADTLNEQSHNSGFRYFAVK